MRQRIIVKAPCLSMSGYGEQSRFALRALRAYEDKYEIFVIPLKWGETGWIHSDTEERKWLDERIRQTILYVQNGGQFDISFQITIPNEWEPMAPINIGYTAGIETNKGRAHLARKDKYDG